MSTWQERVGIELDQLTERLTALESFLNGDKVETLDGMQQSLLADQARHMRSYQSCLVRRLEQAQ